MNLELETDRLTLVPYAISDADVAVEVFTDPKVLRFAGGAMAEDEVRRDIHQWVRRGGNGCIGVWCIRTRDSGEKLGTGALLPMPIEQDKTDLDLVVPGRMPDADIEIGYYLKRSAWGNGYATEACRRLLRFAFEQSPLTEVVATCHPDNVASRNVLLKSGFIDCGTRRSYGVDGPFFRITRRDWIP